VILRLLYFGLVNDSEIWDIRSFRGAGEFCHPPRTQPVATNHQSMQTGNAGSTLIGCILETCAVYVDRDDGCLMQVSTSENCCLCWASIIQIWLVPHAWIYHEISHVTFLSPVTLIRCTLELPFTTSWLHCKTGVTGIPGINPGCFSLLYKNMESANLLSFDPLLHILRPLIVNFFRSSFQYYKT